MKELLIRILLERAREALEKVQELEPYPELIDFILAEVDTWLQEKL